LRLNIKPTIEGILKIPAGKSGLYFFYGDRNELLYIGKAKNLRSRVRGHHRCYLFHCEGMFYRGILEKKGWNPQNRDEWDNNFLESWVDFEVRGMSQITPLAIDYHWFKIKKITIEELSHEETKEKEKQLIKQFNPLYNSQYVQSISDEYYNAFHF